MMLRTLSISVSIASVLWGTCSHAQQFAAGASVTQARDPFRLNAIEQAYLNQVLEKWESKSSQVKTFSCPFIRYEYNAFSPAPNQPALYEYGDVSYQQPDKGSFRIREVWRWKSQPVTPGSAPAQPKGEYAKDPNAIGEHWVCDGKAVFEYKTEQKQLHVRPIPQEMQGKSIVDGPLPFLFGAEADKLKRRFWMKVSPAKNRDGSTNQEVIRLAARPKLQADAAEYRGVEVDLDRVTLLPRAMNVVRPDLSRTAYVFYAEDAKVNNLMGQILSRLFATPRTPRGWKRVEEPIPPTRAASQLPGLAPR